METGTEVETRLIATLEESHLNCHYDVLCALFCWGTKTGSGVGKLTPQRRRFPCGWPG